MVNLQIIKLVVALLLPGAIHCGDAKAQTGWVYQNAPIAALMAGLLDGTQSCKSLLQHGGDVGLGTFDHLDGEMIVLEGTVFAARQSGSVEQLKDCSTPFATVANFSADARVEHLSSLDLHGVETAIDGLVPSKNEIIMLKIAGDFNAITVRVAPRQEKPYSKLVDAVRNQPIFKRQKVKGTVVGFRFPAFVSGSNVPGYHFHYISEDRKFAGHVFSMDLAKGSLTYDRATGLQLKIPTNDTFRGTNLDSFSVDDVNKVERLRK